METASPTLLAATASGLMMEKVRSMAMVFLLQIWLQK
jgi:hypothetical protein